MSGAHTVLENAHRRKHEAVRRRRRSYEAVRVILGIASFAWAALLLLARIMPSDVTDTAWPFYLLAGAAFGAISTRATRNARQGTLGRVLAVLAALALAGFVGMFFVNIGDIRLEFSIVALTLLPLPLWLFLSSRATASEFRESG